MIRQATPADASGIAQVHVESWQAIYRGLLPDDYLDGLDPEQGARFWQGALEKGLAEVAVSEKDSQITGFVSLAPSRDQDADDWTGELTAIYLKPSVWRQGAGQGLMDWAKATAGARGWRRLTLWVLKENARARDFYAATGWHLDESTKVDSVNGVEIVEVRYVWAP